MGKFGLGVRNERGDRIIEFSEEKKIVTMNLFLKLPSRCLHKWKSPAYYADQIVRNPIDFIIQK